MVIELKKIFFPAVIIFLFLTIDAFLFSEIDEVKKFPAFKTETLDGVEVTEKIFENKITALCIWTTTQENFEVLEQLNEMQKNLPAEVQIIGLVGDKHFADAEKIAKKYSPQILQLTANDDFYIVLEKIRQVPTTIFIDENLNLIGQPAGSDAKFISRELDYILQKNSPQFAAQKKIQEFVWFR
mgnify:CR=1 FL=1